MKFNSLIPKYSFDRDINLSMSIRDIDSFYVDIKNIDIIF